MVAAAIDALGRERPYRLDGHHAIPVEEVRERDFAAAGLRRLEADDRLDPRRLSSSREDFL
jgi:hypothetical protein